MDSNRALEWLVLNHTVIHTLLYRRLGSAAYMIGQRRFPNLEVKNCHSNHQVYLACNSSIWKSSNTQVEVEVNICS